MFSLFLPQISTVYLKTSLIPFLGILYVIHKIIIAENRHFLIIYIIALLALAYKFLEQNQTKSFNVKGDYEFLNELLTIAQKKDKIKANEPKTYHIAKCFIHGDSKTWKSLKLFKVFENIAPAIYDEIISDIVHFYEEYGFVFKKSDNASHDLLVLIDMRNKIMNEFQYLELKINIDFTHIVKMMRKINFNILISLNNCIKIISKKYRANYKIAPNPFNLPGTKHELF